MWISDHPGLTPAGSVVQIQDQVPGKEKNKQLVPGITGEASAHLSGSPRLLLPGKDSTTQRGAGGSKPHKEARRQGMGESALPAHEYFISHHSLVPPLGL